MTKYAPTPCLPQKSLSSTRWRTSAAVSVRDMRTASGRGWDTTADRFRVPVPGVGYGGVLLSQGREGAGPDRPETTSVHGVLKAVEDVNESQKKVIFEKILSHFKTRSGASLGDTTLTRQDIAIWASRVQAADR